MPDRSFRPRRHAFQIHGRSIRRLQKIFGPVGRIDQFRQFFHLVDPGMQRTRIDGGIAAALIAVHDFRFRRQHIVDPVDEAAENRAAIRVGHPEKTKQGQIRIRREDRLAEFLPALSRFRRDLFQRMALRADPVPQMRLVFLRIEDETFDIGLFGDPRHQTEIAAHRFPVRIGKPVHVARHHASTEEIVGETGEFRVLQILHVFLEPLIFPADLAENGFMVLPLAFAAAGQIDPHALIRDLRLKFGNILPQDIGRGIAPRTFDHFLRRRRAKRSRGKKQQDSMHEFSHLIPAHSAVLLLS